jgi:hypothetical protein
MATSNRVGKNKKYATHRIITWRQFNKLIFPQPRQFPAPANKKQTDPVFDFYKITGHPVPRMNRSQRGIPVARKYFPPTVRTRSKKIDYNSVANRQIPQDKMLRIHSVLVQL